MRQPYIRTAPQIVCWRIHSRYVSSDYLIRLYFLRKRENWLEQRNDRKMSGAI